MTFSGLTAKEALQRLNEWGPNALPVEERHPLLSFLQKFWSPVPWMLEVIILFEIGMGRFLESAMIALLLAFNVVVSFFQEGKAKNALRLLQSRLNVQARVLRDGQWSLIKAEELVPGDVIRIRMGDIIPADVKLLSGYLLIDQSTLTGESLPQEAKEGALGYAGSVVKNGEADAEVLTTGKNTYFGKTAEIMRSTKVASHLEKTIFTIVKYLVVFAAVLVILLFFSSFYRGVSLYEVVPFSLLLLVASVPVALPATFVLATSIGAIELAKSGVLVTRLSAIEEAAAMNILCADKTGTITQNALKVSALFPSSPFTKEDLLIYASLASEESTQDPLDLAILQAVKKIAFRVPYEQRIRFIPFDSNKKYSEALIRQTDQNLWILKGAPSQLMSILSSPTNEISELERMIASEGARVFAVVAGPENDLKLVGLIGVQDPLREDSKEIIRKIQDLGIKVMMITGDSAITALAVAKKVGMETRILLGENLHEVSAYEVSNKEIIAGVFPEDKFKVITILQSAGYVCGMTGDGVNDAPALKRAEVGIAMSNATDVAKASASLVLTNPGLGDVVEAVKTSRRIYQRMLTYTLNKIIKTTQIALLLGVGLLLLQEFIISQLLIVLLLFANDFVTMTIATDKVSFSQKPDKWDIRKLSGIGGLFAAFILMFSFFVLFAGVKIFFLPLSELRTLIFLVLVYTGQATVYLVRERTHFWHSMPSFWMIGCSLLDISIVSFLALYGIMMAPLSPLMVFGLLAAVIFYFVLLDFVKVPLFKFIKLNG